ncbi:MAG: T9SS type A sorting domain-containing protein [Bacteroidota bacterium]
MRKVFIISLLFVLSGSLLQSQNFLKIVDYSYSDYPLMKLRFFAYSANGELIVNPDRNNYSISDNGAVLNFSGINCNLVDLNNKNSLVLSLDKALSLGDANQLYLKLAKRIFDTLSFLMSAKENEIAITSFDTRSYLNHDFSNNYVSLSRAIYAIPSSSSSSINKGLQYNLLGSLNIAKLGGWKRSIIIATQGVADFQADYIAQIANRDSISVFFVYFGAKAPAEIIELCKSTNGICFDNINNLDDITPLVNSLFYLVSGSEPCSIDFIGNYDCSEHHTIRLTDISSGYFDEFEFDIIDKDKPTIQSNPPYLSYSSVPIGQTLTQDITITAINSDITINSIRTENPLFSIVAGAIANPFVLAKNQSHTISIRYSPLDSAIVFTRLIIESNACIGNEVFITGGFPNRPPKEKTIEIVNPKCGETLVVGDTVDIRWNGLLPKDIIQLEYSIDDGKNWHALAKNIENLSYRWVVPDMETNNLLIRAVQLWPNNVGRTLNLEHRNSVNSAFFNTICDRVVTASDDSTVVVWNSNNGDKIATFNFSDKVNYAVFDKTGNYILVAVKDGYVYKYNLSNLKLEGMYYHNINTEVLNVQVCPHNQRFVSTTKDGSFYIWNLNGSLIKKIVYNGDDYALYATFDAAGSMIMVNTQSGRTKFYNIDGNEIYSIDTKLTGQTISYSRNGAINSNNTLIAAVNDPDNSAVIYNFNDKTLKYKIQHKSDDTTRVFINYLSFFYNPDDNTEYLLSAGTDNTVRRWIARDGSIPKGLDGKDTLHIFREHTKPVMTSVFNFDGSRLLTASWDSTAKIWNLNQRDLQMDTVDCMLSIGKAKIETISVDFGDVYLNDVSVRTQGFIKNLKNFKFQIKELSFFGPDLSEFQIINKFNTPFILKENELLNISIRFEPKTPGDKRIYAKIVIPGDTIYAEIKGRGIGYGLTSLSDVVDFGTLDINDYRDTTLVGFIRNISQSNITIDSIYFAGPTDKYFKLLSFPETPFVLSSNQSLDLNLRFIPYHLGRSNGVIAIKHSGSQVPLLINLFGNATGVLFDSLQIEVGNITGASGKIVELPIKITNLSENKLLKLNNIKASLSFNSTMLAPIGNFADDVIDLYNRTITFVMPFDGRLSENHFSIKFHVGTGNDTVTALKLFNVYPIEDIKVKFITTDGSFKLTGYCNQGGPRLFDPVSGNFSLAQNRPNPFTVSTTIDFELLEQGFSSLKIYDLTGQLIKVVFEEYRKQGKYSVILNAVDIAPGLYYYVLETPTQKYIRNMRVLK